MIRAALTTTALVATLAGAGGAGAVGLTTMGRGFTSAVAVVQAPGESRLLVVERSGLIRPIDRSGRPGRPWLDIRDRVGAEGNEQGLLGIAFARDFIRTGRVYVDYTDRRGDTRVAEFRTRPGARSVSPRTARIVLTQRQPHANHNGGALAVGPDGMLYVSLGDGGGQGDPDNRAGDPRSLVGKVLRINPSRPSAGRGYAIPGGNPFAGTSGARPEIWLLGLRNPWRMSFDRATGDLWIGDVGEYDREEVDVARRGQSGLDFGWSRREGTADFKGGPRRARETAPVAEYAHGAGDCSIIGGYVYRGTAVPVLAGRYLYADWCSGRSWSVDAAAPGRPAEITAVLGRIPGITSFGEDQAGEIYVVTNATVRRITG